MDDLERQMMLEAGADTADALRYLAEESGNVDASGNFSIQVLNRALERSHGVALTHASSEEHSNTGGSSSGSGGVLGAEAFVLNRSAHWFTVRKLYGRYWNLNSTLERPEPIGELYLSALLHQFRLDG